MRDHVTGRHQRGNLVHVTREVDTLRDAELAGERIHALRVRFLAEQGAASDDRVDFRQACDRMEEDVLSFPGADASEHADEWTVCGAEGPPEGPHFVRIL